VKWLTFVILGKYIRESALRSNRYANDKKDARCILHIGVVSICLPFMGLNYICFNT